MHKILPSHFIVSSILDEQVFGRKGKYINDPHILKERAVTDAFLQENILKVKVRQRERESHNNYESYIVSPVIGANRQFLVYYWSFVENTSVKQE